MRHLASSSQEHVITRRTRSFFFSFPHPFVSSPFPVPRLLPEGEEKKRSLRIILNVQPKTRRVRRLKDEVRRLWDSVRKEGLLFFHGGDSAFTPLGNKTQQNNPFFFFYCTTANPTPATLATVYAPQGFFLFLFFLFFSFFLFYFRGRSGDLKTAPIQSQETTLSETSFFRDDGISSMIV